MSKRQRAYNSEKEINLNNVFKYTIHEEFIRDTKKIEHSLNDRGIYSTAKVTARKRWNIGEVGHGEIHYENFRNKVSEPEEVNRINKEIKFRNL